MILLLQRVSEARVAVGGAQVAAIGRGLLVFAGVEKTDAPAEVARLAERLVGYRIFPDAGDRMNLSVSDVQGEVLLVPQFTLAADTDRGRRPSFDPAAEPGMGAALFAALVNEVGKLHERVAVGLFGADMQVSLINDGPVTFLLRG